MYTSLEWDESEQPSNSGQFTIADSPWVIGQYVCLCAKDQNKHADPQLEIREIIERF
jgi:hypothetical protein